MCCTLDRCHSMSDECLWQQCALRCCAGSQQHVLPPEYTSFIGRDDSTLVYCTHKTPPQIMLGSHTMLAHVLQGNSGMNMVVGHAQQQHSVLSLHAGTKQLDTQRRHKERGQPKQLKKWGQQMEIKAAQEVGKTNGNQSSSRSGGTKWKSKQLKRWAQSMQPGSLPSIAAQNGRL